MSVQLFDRVIRNWRLLRPLASALALAAFMTVVTSIMIFTSKAKASESPTGDIEKGRVFAEETCAECHAIGVEGDSPLAEAPKFRELSQRYPIDDLAEALAEGIVTAHPEMPEVELDPDQINDFLSYLKSIQTN